MSEDDRGRDFPTGSPHRYHAEMDEPPYGPFEPNRALALEDRRALVPADARAKGIFLNQIVAAAERGSGRRPEAARARYYAFKGYDYHEWLQLLPACAALAHPTVPAGEGLRRLGRAAYGTFFDTSIGKVVMGLASDFDGAVRLAQRAYKALDSIGSIDIELPRRGLAVVRLRGMPDFPESYHVGVFEGAMAAFEARGEAEVRVHSLADVDLRLRWD